MKRNVPAWLAGSAVGRVLRPRLVAERDAGIVAEIFDAEGYKAMYPEVAEAGVDPWLHYRKQGAAEGRSPSPLFDPAWYLAKYRDVADVGMDPVVHYTTFGAAEGRDPHPLFSTSWYTSLYPDVVEAGINPLVHYQRFGGPEQRDPHPLFDSSWYSESYPDAVRSGRNPLVDYLLEGARAGRDPNPYFSGKWYLSHYPQARASGLNPLVHFVESGERQGYHPGPGGPVPRRSVDVLRGAAALKMRGRTDVTSPRFLLDSRWMALEPLKVFRGSGRPRVNVVTDSVGPESLFGGVATSLILACLWAGASNRGLRVITRTTAPEATGLDQLRTLYGLPDIGNPEFVLHGPDAPDALDVRDGDVFLTTSWWSTLATAGSVSRDRICYLLQEDERVFYPAGDDSLRAGQVMSDPRILAVVNSPNLYEHLLASGCDNLAERGTWFEPSFELFAKLPKPVREPLPREFFFYARPNNPRNLYYLGLEVLEEAFDRAVLDPAQWRVHFVGSGAFKVELPGQPETLYHPRLSWSQYADLITRMDLGLSLMATPHTSYPPLDLAGAGAYVVTNAWAGKTDLSHYGSGILTAQPRRQDLVSAIGRAASLIEAGVRPETTAALIAPWPQALAGVLDRLEREFPSV